MAPIFFFAVTAGDQTVAIDTLSTPSQLLIWSKRALTRTHCICTMYQLKTIDLLGPLSIFMCSCHFILHPKQQKVNTEQCEHWEKRKYYFLSCTLRFNCYLLELITKKWKVIFWNSKNKFQSLKMSAFLFVLFKLQNFWLEVEKFQEISQWSGKIISNIIFQ